jgi:uncharacterized protein
MMRIVVDTNVIVSALVFGGVPRQILALVDRSVCVFYYSNAIRTETERILQEKFGWSPNEIRRLRGLWKWGTQLDPEVSLTVVAEDPDDDRILECAIAAEAHAIVSGDRHLLRLGSFRSIPIQSPRQFVEAKAWESS